MAETDISTYSFDDLEIRDELLRGFHAYGFEKPSNIQYKSIPFINEGHDVIAQSRETNQEYRDFQSLKILL